MGTARRRRARWADLPTGPVARTAGRHAPPQAEALLALQRAAGNRAVARVVAGPAPVPYEPDQPLAGSELGVTRLVRSPLPSFVVRARALAASTPGPVEVDARYVSPGLHDWGAGKDGRARKLLVPQAVSDLARDGEQEHSDDLATANQLVAGEAARAIGVLAGEGPAPAEAVGAAGAHAHWRQRLHDVISPKLRIAADASDPAKGGSVTQPWNDALAALQGATLARDERHWHTMGTRAASADEVKANPVPEGTRLVVAEAKGEIGEHPSEALIGAAFAALPDRA